MGAVIWARDREHARDKDGAALWLFRRRLVGGGARQVGGQVCRREGPCQVAPPAKAVAAAQRAWDVVEGRGQHAGLGLGLERDNVHLVRVAAIGHAGAAEHALEARVDQVRGLSGTGLGLGLGLGLHVGVLVDVGHGGYRGAASAGAREAAHRRRARRRLSGERGAAGV